MNGQIVYEQQYINKIESLLNNHKDKKYLRGFYNYMNDLAYSTIYDYLSYVLNFMLYTEKDVGTLTLDDYTDYLATLRQKTSSYRISTYSGLKKFSLYLKAANKNIENPMQYVPRPKFRESTETEIKREKGFLEKKEIKRYITATEKGVGSSRAIARQASWKERDMLIILLFLNTGMRCSALFKLNIDDINLNNYSLITREKGDKTKEHDLSPELMEMIIAWMEKRKSLLKDKDENALFISNQKTRMTQSSIARVVKKFAQGIDGKNITPHKLRATYGTHLYDETKDLYFVQKSMGHANPQVTKLYIRGQGENHRKAASNIMSKITF